MTQAKDELDEHWAERPYPIVAGYVTKSHCSWAPCDTELSLMNT